ncbi:MAG: hypothetical protein BroJett040_16160 [Oligoflexia bacterium]|nr:MAG: hypothetical protein BroJett040_16160 [Oligoflexia bacterium]
MQQIEKITQKTLKNSLETVIQTAQGGLHLWARNVETEVMGWAQSPELQKITIQLLNIQNKTNSHFQRKLLKEYRNLLGIIMHRDDHVGALLIAPDGKQIASMYDGRLGKSEFAQASSEAVNQALSGKTLISQPFLVQSVSDEINEKLQPVILSLSPVRDTNQKIIAVFAIILNPERDFTDILRLGRIGATGETYAFSKEGRFITPSRFESYLIATNRMKLGESSILSVGVYDPKENDLTRIVQLAMKGFSGVEVVPYSDYRGVPVVGAWIWDEKLHLGIVTELDADEAYKPLRVTKKLVFSMLGVALLGALIGIALLWKSRNSVEKAVSMRDEFISIASHELRTPLTAIRLSLEMIPRLIEKHIPEDIKNRVQHKSQIGLNQVDRLDRLIEDLLDVSRIRVAKFSIEKKEITLSDHVREIGERHREALKKMGSDLKIDIPEQISGMFDPSRIEQVVANLLTNAIRYGNGKPVTLSLSKGENMASLQVIDQGIGISSADQKRIFARFERAVPEGKHGGLGLGLYITKSIVEAHGGTIRVDSQVGQGTTFTVDLPLT